MVLNFYIEILEQVLGKDRLKPEKQDYICKNIAGCIFSEESSNYDRIISERQVQLLENKITERKIRLGCEVPNLELKPYKNGNKEQIKFIYDLKKEVYQKYVENIYGEWNEEIQKKLFDKFMKENLNNIELIYLKDELVRILQWKRNRE